MKIRSVTTMKRFFCPDLKPFKRVAVIHLDFTKSKCDIRIVYPTDGTFIYIMMYLHKVFFCNTLRVNFNCRSFVANKQDNRLGESEHAQTKARVLQKEKGLLSEPDTKKRKGIR